MYTVNAAKEVQCTADKSHATENTQSRERFMLLMTYTSGCSSDQQGLTLVGRVPFVDGKVVVTGDGGDCWAGDGWVGVGSNVNDR